MKYSVNNEFYDVILKTNTRLKYIKISVADGIITVKSPSKITDAHIIKILDNNYDFLEKNIGYKTAKSDENIAYIFGQRYGVKKYLTKKNNVFIEDEYLVIETKKLENPYITKLVIKFLISKLEPKLLYYINEAKKVFSNDVNTDISVSVKNVKSYYGKCKPYQKEMYFSYLLAKLPDDLIKYVVYHEFAHLKHLNHSKDFYNYLDQKLHGATTLDKKLRKVKSLDSF